MRELESNPPDVSTNGQNRIVFDRAHSYLSYMTITTNRSGQRQTFKIKSSSNE